MCTRNIHFGLCPQFKPYLMAKLLRMSPIMYMWVALHWCWISHCRSECLMCGSAQRYTSFGLCQINVLSSVYRLFSLIAKFHVCVLSFISIRALVRTFGILSHSLLSSGNPCLEPSTINSKSWMWRPCKYTETAYDMDSPNNKYSRQNVALCAFIGLKCTGAFFIQEM